MGIRAALDTALDDTDPRDAAAIALARALADDIDTGGPLDKLAPKLLQTLEALLLTPKARTAVMGAQPDANQPTSPLDDLRARRRARQAKAVDTTAT